MERIYKYLVEILFINKTILIYIPGFMQDLVMAPGIIIVRV